jgi:dihydropteroate synthase
VPAENPAAVSSRPTAPAERPTPPPAAALDPADVTDTAVFVEPPVAPRAAASAVSSSAEASRVAAEVPRVSGRRASAALDPHAQAAERLAADRAAVAAQGEALRRAAQRRRETEAVRPAPTVEGGVRQIVTPAAQPAASPRSDPTERRLIAGGVFGKPLVETPAGVSSVTGSPDPEPASSEPIDVATRAIAVVREAGPGPSGTETAVPFRPSRTLVMGILNVTLDSFSDGGRYTRFDDALAHANRLVAEGADIIDIGGESTRPGAARVEVHEEQRRVLPVIRELRSRGHRVSVDTMNAATAYAAVEAGATIINDVSGGLADKRMAQVVVDTDSTYIAMHWRGHSDVMNSRATYANAVAEVKAELFQRVAELVIEGVNPDRIVIDPGLGFAKHAEHNWQLLGHLDELAELGLPVLVAASRKRFLGGLLPEEAGVRERDPATAVISALGAQAGAWAVRVHDVASTRAALDVWEAWQKGSRG